MSLSNPQSSSKDTLDKQISKLKHPLSAKTSETQNFPNHKLRSNLTFRPATGKPSDSLLSFRLSQKPQTTIRDKLYEENLSLKSQANTLESENLKLRTKLNQLSKEINKKEDTELFFYKTISKTSLVPNLKYSIKDIKSKIKTKNEEIEKLRKSVKSTKMMETDVELQIYSDELKRLRFHLEGVMRDNSINFSMLEFEEQLQRMASEITSIKDKNMEYGKNLAGAREELANIMGNIKTLETPLKKRKIKISQKQEIENLKKQMDEIIEKISEERESFEDRKKKLQIDIENVQKQNKDILETTKITESKLKEQNIVADQLKFQISNHEKEVKRAQTNILSFSSNRVRKLKDPPKLFQKIYTIIHKKKMFLDIFFSLMDKNSNGVIDIDEIFTCLSAFGHKIKKKHILEAFKLMEISGSSIPLSIIQEYYEKYEYKLIEDDSSSEEVPEPVKKVERLSFKAPVGVLQEGVILPNQGPVQRVVREDKKIPTVLLEEVKPQLLEIQRKMQKMQLGKNKLLNSMFGSNVDPDEILTVERLTSIFKESVLGLKSESGISILSRFLLEPENTKELLESQIVTLKGGLLTVCKKLSNLFEDWHVYSEDDLNKAIEVIKGKIAQRKEEVVEACKKIDLGHTGSIGLADFQNVCKEFLPDAKIWDVWTVSLYPAMSIDYLRFLASVYEKKSPEVILGMLVSSLNKFNTPPESLFEVSTEGVIEAENFIEGVQKLNLELTNEEQFNLLDAIGTTQPGKFAKIIHIAELNRKLIDRGYKLQILSDDELNLY